METETAYGGMTAGTSDYGCADGDLALSLNLVEEDGSLRPVPRPEVRFYLGTDEEAWFLHSSAGYSHYVIVRGGSELLYADGERPATDDRGRPELFPLWDAGSGTEIYGMNSVGNVLVVLTSGGMEYFLWKGASDGKPAGYLHLGSHLPECHLRLGLEGELVTSEEYTLKYTIAADDDATAPGQDGLAWPGRWETDRDEWRHDAEEAFAPVFANVNRFAAEEGQGKGRFIYPFLARFAYRLYDGSLTMQSAPVLMECDTGRTPHCVAYYFEDKNDAAPYFRYKVAAVACDLVWGVESQSEADSLAERWGDVVKSVDVFVSAPIYRYKQSGEMRRIMDRGTDTLLGPEWGSLERARFVGRLRNDPDSEGSGCHYRRDFLDMWTDVTGWDRWLSGWKDYGHGLDYPVFELALPCYTDKEVEEAVSSASSFYLVKSIPVGELTTGMNRVEIPADFLQSLLERETLPDDYGSHDQLLPRYSYSYNARLHLADMRTRAFCGFNPGVAVQYTDRTPAGRMSPPSAGSPRTKRVSVRYRISRGGGSLGEFETDSGFCPAAANARVDWLFYPDADAKEAVVTFEDLLGGRETVAVKLSEHPTLNGAYFFRGLDKGVGPGSVHAAWPEDAGAPLRRYGHGDEGAPPSEGDTQEAFGKLYVSEAYDPFVFPASGIVSVGGGRITGVAAATRALSQGQFGQFPLYCLCTDGVWSLTTGADGTYSSVQPVTRDVCLRAAGIAQLDSSVAFASARGVVHLSGSSTEVLSDALDTLRPFRTSDLPCAGALFGVFDSFGASGLWDGLAAGWTEQAAFPDFAARCSALYDYAHGRLLLFDPDPRVRHAYCYSSRSGKWGMLWTDVLRPLNSYPEALATVRLLNPLDGGAESNGVADFCSYGPGGAPYLLVTRPLKLGPAGAMKTPDTVVQRGAFGKGVAAQVLYGSRDLRSWHVVRSAAGPYMAGFGGTPYKYFRVAAAGMLGTDESLRGFTARFRTRLEDRPR